jgi:dihydroflavonol-4-reductase
VKPALVTGASGFIGWHVANLLLDRGCSVRALCRPTSTIDLPGVEKVTGDLRDPDSLARAAAGCGVIYHIAADYRLWARNPQELYQSNVEGTRSLIAAAKHAGAERFVYTSTVGCIEPPDETQPVTLDQMEGAYKRSKFLAEAVAKEERELPVVIVNPTAPIGDHDVKPTPTGAIVLDFLKGDLPAFIDTGLNLVDVQDVALGHILAAEKGRPGERYILGCENLTLEQILQKLSSMTGRKTPTMKLPYAVAYAAGMITTGWSQVSGKPPRVPIDAVRMAKKKMFVSHAKAAAELGYAPGSVEWAMQRAIDWFQQNEYC